MVSQRRDADAQKVFHDSKNKTNHTKAIIYDGLKSYDEAFQKEYFSLKNLAVQNIGSVSDRHEGLNSKIERSHADDKSGLKSCVM